jgi:predicted enzyme related to lactoylglutathione lyase
MVFLPKYLFRICSIYRNEGSGKQYLANREGKNYISKVIYHVRNLQKSMDFYSKIYELDVKQTSVTSALVGINEDQEIELIEHNSPKDNCTNNKGQCHYALIVKEIVACAQDIKEKGIQIWYGPKAMTKPYTTYYIPVRHSEQTYNFYYRIRMTTILKSCSIPKTAIKLNTQSKTNIFIASFKKSLRKRMDLPS